MKPLFFFVLAILPSASFAQELKGTGGIGYANVTVPDAKRIVFYSARGLAYEFTSHKAFYLQFGLQIGTLKFNAIDGTGRTLLDKRQFLLLPVSVRKYYLMKNDASFFFDLGIAGTYDFLHTIEWRNSDKPEKNNNNGYSLSGMGSAGYKKMFRGGYGLELAFQGQFDFLTDYKKEINEIKTDKRLLVVSFLKKIRE